MTVEARIPGRPPAVLVYLGSPGNGPSPDLPGLARAVERLVRSIAPEVVTRVTLAPPPPREAERESGDLSEIADLGEAADLGKIADLGDGLTLDTAGRRLISDGVRRPLTRREFDLLHHLHRRAGVALSRRELMTTVWGSGYVAGDRTIDVHVRRLRVKLGRHADRITTLRGYGYRFD